MEVTKRTMSRIVLIVSMLATCSGLTSCSRNDLKGYEGEVLPDEETALILGQPRRARGVRRAEITSVQLPHGTMAVETTRARVLPGETCITARVLSERFQFSFAYMCFEAEAGEIYEVSVGTLITDFYNETRVDSIRVIDLSTRDSVTVAARLATNCETSPLVSPDSPRRVVMEADAYSNGLLVPCRE
jgi:hypothetical protein